ncbi:MAG TPA: small acid-soluble spore protein O [Virgibacillus sp.]|nr:small acid-soluble spore protein O [Virgibacillus sp.]
MGNDKQRQKKGTVSDEQKVRKHLSREYDHEFANEPLTPNEKHNNKKTKKRQ